MTRCVVNMTIFDADHYSDEQRKAIIYSYPEHERDARTRGVPVMGSGRVFPVAEERITCEPIHIPEHWPQLNGLGPRGRRLLHLQGIPRERGDADHPCRRDQAVGRLGAMCVAT
jgi:hypothetical protein